MATRPRLNHALRIHEDRPFDLNSLKDREFLNSEKNQLAAERDNSSQEVRENERALCSQLILVATVLLTASMLAVGNSDLFKTMTYDQKWLTMLSVAALVGSIITGIKHYFVLLKFYMDWAYAKQKIALIYGEVKCKTPLVARKKSIALTADLKNEPYSGWLKAQIWLLSVAGIAYLVLLVAIFFSFYSITRHLPLRLQ